MGLSNFRRKASIAIRKHLETRSMRFSADEISQFRFYQFKASTAEFFHARLGKTDIRVSDTPHFQLAAAYAGENPAEVLEAERYYEDYLKASWATVASPQLSKRLASFREHFELFKRGESASKPVVARLGSCPDHFIIDGNHRSAFAAALGYDIDVELWPSDLAFLRFSHVKEFYGAGNRNMPYRGLFLSAEEAIPGRRNDAIRRLAMIPPEALVGATVLDVASNVGMSSILSHSFGVAKSMGLEKSGQLVNIASRFAMFNGTYPHSRFLTFDLEVDNLPANATFDTAFFFSIYKHLRKPETLFRIARNHIKHQVVFEGHPGSTRDDYRPFFDSGIFQEVKKLGELPFSKFRADPPRALWICRK